MGQRPGAQGGSLLAGGAGDAEGGTSGPPADLPKAKSILPRDEPASWFEAARAAESAAGVAASTSPGSPAPAEAVAAARERGERLLTNEARAFERSMWRTNPSDARWLVAVRKAGTTRDRLAASALVVQERAIANLRALDELISWVAKSKGGRAVVGQSIDALRELFKSVLLPDRRLTTLEQRDLCERCAMGMLVW